MSQINEAKAKITLLKWRLVFGKKAEDHGIQMPQDVAGFITQTGLSLGQRLGAKGMGAGPSPEQGKGKEKTRGTGGKGAGDPTQGNVFQRIEQTIDYVYSPKTGARGASSSGSGINIPIWLREVNTLFPKQAKEHMERELVKRSNIEEIINHPELFEKVEANMEMLGVILSMKHMLPHQVKEKAKQIIAKVVKELIEKLKMRFKIAITGSLNRNLHNPVKCFRNLDWKLTIARNLKHYNSKLKKIILDNPQFFSRQRRKEQWQIIVMIDESGSMGESIIYSAVIASIFAEIPAIKTNLLIFDTEVVDLSDKVGEPIDVLMEVTLGGGTNISKALQYGQKLAVNPRKTLYILITDLYEGGGYPNLTHELIAIRESNAKLLCLAALGRNAEPMFNREYGHQMNKMGFDVIASTPEDLAPIIGRIFERG